DRVATLPRFLLVDQAAGEVGVDRLLLAGQRIEHETGRDFRYSPAAFGNHDELDHEDDQEDDRADGGRAGGDEMAERSPDFTSATHASGKIMPRCECSRRRIGMDGAALAMG